MPCWRLYSFISPRTPALPLIGTLSTITLSITSIIAIIISAIADNHQPASVPALAAANRLYERLGFYPIERYNDGPGTIHGEMFVSFCGPKRRL